jgi:hypothetical protein
MVRLARISEQHSTGMFLDESNGDLLAVREGTVVGRWNANGQKLDISGEGSGELLTYDGSDWVSVAMSGDASFTSAGVFTAKHETQFSFRIPSTSGIDTDAKNGGLAGCDQALDVTAAEADATHCKVYDSDSPTKTEADATYCKVYDDSATAYANLEDASTGDFTQWALLPANTQDADAVYFGDDATFSEIWINMSATNQTYTGDATTWEYYNGSTWGTLTLTSDGTDSTAGDGKRSFQQDGYIAFTAPGDWAQVEIDGVTAYWIRANAGTAANISQVGLTDSKRHYTVTRAAAYANLEDASSSEFVQWQLLPNNTSDDDEVLFGADVPFCQLFVDMSATNQTYSDDATLWKYWDGSAWSALTLAHDYTDATAQDGKRSFGRDGAISFVPPTDWATASVDGVNAYWVKCVAGTAANISQVGITNSKRHYVCSPADGFKVQHDCTVTDIAIRDEAGTVHTAADIKFALVNFTTGAHSGELTFAQDKRNDSFASLTLSCSSGDNLGVLVTQEDGTNEMGPFTLEIGATLT